MKRIRVFPFLLTAIFVSMISSGQTNKPTDYLNVPGPVVFDTKSYNLSWSSHPAATFYKQEYLVKGDNADKFNTMILLDVITGTTDIKKAAAAKIAELKTAKQTNPAVTYETFDNPKSGEYMIDFVLTANTPEGKISIAERNVYRYTSFTNVNGQKGILLFGVSTRSYGSDIEPFLAGLKTNKQELVNQVAQFKIPAIRLLK